MPQIPEKTYSDLDWRGVLEQLAARCQTERGAQRARDLIPLERQTDAAARLQLVGQVRQLGAEGPRISLDGVGDLRQVLERVQRHGVLAAEDLLAVAATLRVCGTLRQLGGRLADSLTELSGVLRSLSSLADVRGAIDDSFDDKGELVDHASAELGALRSRARSLREEAHRRLKRLIADPSMQPKLQDDYFTDRDGRYVLPIKAECRHDLRGIVLGSSASGATVFMEPESVIDVNNRTKLATAELEREEQRILAELSGLVNEERQAIHTNLEQLARIDLLVAAGRLADDLGCGEVTFSGPGQLRLVGLRHPMMVLSGVNVVANDVSLTPGATLVVTGPNTGGKTVLLKSVGLSALMVRAGLVPSCQGASEIPFYQTVLSDMGDDQSIAASLSTFSAHMTNIGRLLEGAGADALVLLDEVAVGTDPIQGAALARAIVEALADREAQVLVTTHYPQMKEMPSRDIRFFNASMGFDLEQVRPTYRLIMNTPGSSSALSVARKLGLPAELLERAGGLLDPAAARLDGLIEQLEKERVGLQEDRIAAQGLRERLARELQEAERERRVAEKERRALHQKGYDEAVVALRGARDDLDRARRQLRRAEGEEDIKRAGQLINRRAGEVAANAPRTKRPDARPAEPPELTVGAEVWVERLGGLARVVDGAGEDTVLVQAGALKSRIARSEALVLMGRVQTAVVRSKPSLLPPPSMEAPRSRPRGEPAPRAAPQDDLHHYPEPQTTCDLRGLRVDEAEEALVQFLDRVMLEEARSVLVIHGHGTGALKRFVREQIRLSAAIRRWRPGERGEGGDGVTVAWFS